MIHKVVEILHHYLLEHIQVRNHDMRLLSDIITVGIEINVQCHAALNYHYNLYTHTLQLVHTPGGGV